jgi:adenosylhomocysteine nucleosidase
MHWGTIMILIIGAMQEELKHIPEHLKSNHRLLITGVGKVNAAMKLTEIIHQERIHAIINLGFAGASGDLQIGELALVKSTSYHDFDLSLFGYDKGQVPGFPPVFHSDTWWLNQAKQIFTEAKEGHLLTGDYFMSEKRDGNLLFDMEGAALYHVAYHYHLPIISIKVISDIVGMDHHLESYRQFEASVGAKRLLEAYLTLFGGAA